MGNCKIAEPMRTDARLWVDSICRSSISGEVPSRVNDSRAFGLSSCEATMPRDAVAPRELSSRSIFCRIGID